MFVGLHVYPDRKSARRWSMLTKNLPILSINIIFVINMIFDCLNTNFGRECHTLPAFIRIIST